MHVIVTSRAFLPSSAGRAPLTAIGRRSCEVRHALCDAQEARHAARQRRSRTTNQTPRARPRRLAASTMRRIARGIERFILEPMFP